MPAYAVEPFALYDNFSAPTIDPVKWAGAEFNGDGTEASRRIDTALGELRVTYRAFGDTTSNSGRTYSGQLLFLRKNPAAIMALQAQVAALAAQATPCAGNPATALTRAGGFHAAFFNTATPTPGSAVNDVRALLFLSRLPTELASSAVHVVAQVFRCKDQACVQVDALKQSDLGTVPLGQLVQLQLEWDKPNHRFLFQRGANPKVAISYAPLSDTAAPGNGLRLLEVGHFVENCTTTPRPVGFADVAVDTVKVNQSATQACDPAYPTVCIPPPPPDLNCADIPYRNFTVLPPDPHRFDGDGDGIGCEQ
jgi:hypothetical protein